MISLSSLAERFCSNDTEGVVQLVAERCLRSRLNSNECRRCLEVCPGSALRLENRRILLDAERCSGCGRCRAVCPSDAFTSVVDITQLIGSLAGKDRAMISCSRQPRLTEDELVLPCLGLLSPPALLAIGSGGCPAITFQTGGCAACVNARATGAFLDDLRAVAGQIEHCCGTRLETSPHGAPEPYLPPPSRRTYLRDLKTSVRPLPAAPPSPSLANNSATSPSGRHIPEKIRFVNQLLATVDESMEQELRSALLPHLSVTPDCTRCPRCAGICPTGALKRKTGESGKQLVFNASRCSNCRLCMEFCPESAITVSEPALPPPRPPHG
ncbi:4Fe-4S binding protein [Desulfofustis glycolicus]|uniref:4Fe-4S dicluster domain-containing protein n=1 Tax=Desulfofustis glycolicus DSM 9705 TaxID=1121409 RepID=A0A1M5T097_9BACT|nr:4Fe-4S binding protein [Desulfofustis glycolicus]MCB2215291.1 4Fe-4S binding protein [Desulfobulbaceae bacterium]SHH44115.1 4Fe-4S dicluster domain-containing protein [Desulfofustis glycolicus DSM 9705]